MGNLYRFILYEVIMCVLWINIKFVMLDNVRNYKKLDIILMGYRKLRYEWLIGWLVGW